MNASSPWLSGRLRNAAGGTAAVFLFVALSGTASAGITISPAARGYDIDITEQTSSTALIDALAGAAAVKVEGYPAESPVAASHLRNASLERALRALLPSARFVVRFNADDTPAAIIFLSSAEDADPGIGMDDAIDPAVMQEPELPMEQEPDPPMEQDPADGAEQ